MGGARRHVLAAPFLCRGRCIIAVATDSGNPNLPSRARPGYDGEKENAMIELTGEQQQALDASAEPRLIDPRTQKTYVLVGAEIFERVRTLLGDDEGPDMRQVAVLVEQAMREEDADDATLDYYQQKYGRQP
jgi:hypothetical protein